MKKLRFLLLTVIALLTSIGFIFGQSSTTNDAGFDFFAPRKISYRLQQTGYYGQMTIYDNGQKSKTYNDTYIDVKGTWWLGKGLGAGLGVEGDWSGTHYTNNNDDLTRKWEISPSLSYGKMLSNKWGFYARGEVDFGKYKDISKTPQNSTTTISDLFGYSGTLGFPYRISKYSALTTTFGYEYSQVKTDDSKTKKNDFGFDIFPEDYVDYSDLKCDPGSKFQLSGDEYQQGDWFLDYDSRAAYHFGKTELNYITPPQTYKDNFFNLDVNFRGSFYVIDNLALGGGLSYNNSGDKININSIKYNTNQLEFDPEAIFNLPGSGAWRNLFVKGGGYLGSYTSEVKYSNNTTTTKESITGYNFGVGYYAFYAEQTALKICTYYHTVTHKDKETDDKTKYKGFAAEVGIVHSF